MKLIKFRIFFLFLFFGTIGCKKNIDTCKLALEPTVATTASLPCTASGKVEITFPTGSNYQYKIGDQPFQNQPTFINLKAGKYSLVVKDISGCETTKEINIDTLAQGAKFKEVVQILAKHCLSCHSGINPHAGLDFSSACVILNNWERIKARAIDGIPSPMPQAGLIPLAERNKISEWINAGHLYGN